MATERWEIDSSHSSIHFSVRHLVIARARGQFSRWTGTVLVTDDDFRQAKVGVTIDASSIDTGVADRDAHLKSADFFDVERYPDITFRTERVERLPDGRLRLAGPLTIKGITRNVSFEAESHGRAKDPWGNLRAAFSARTSIDRRDFGLTWNQTLETGGVVVGDRVEVEIDLEVVKQAAAKVA
jgi:polyisoprenoid-binding protein YceI